MALFIFGITGFLSNSVYLSTHAYKIIISRRGAQTSQYTKTALDTPKVKPPV